MKYPTLNRFASRTVSVPVLSGGINLEDPLNLIDDNQMTNALNLWYKNGAIRTRPAFKTTGLLNFNSVYGTYEDVGRNNTYAFIPDFTFIRNGKKYKLLVTEQADSNADLADTSYRRMGITAFSAVDVLFYASTWYSEGNARPSVLFFEGKSKRPAGQGIFMLLNGNSILELVDHTKPDFISDYNQPLQVYNGWQYTFDYLSSEEIYSPAIYLNGKGNNYSTLPASEETVYAAASLFEGYNLIKNAWQSFYFVTDGVSDSFTVPYNPQEITEFIAELTMSDTEKYTFTAENSRIIPGEDVIFKCKEDDSLSLFCENGGNTFAFKKEGEMYAPESRLGIISNNLVFKVKFFQSENKLSGMSFGTWFGGAADGINGGTRLFLSGNNMNKNLLVWSDVDEPTYFPENNYSYVGNAQSAITALRKQSNMLVIFKENELYYTVYSEGESYDQEDIRSGSVVDVTTIAATFPLIHIHAEVGCDLPQTIQLCNDRLIWACKNRQVYILKNASQYSTANISPISKMCERALREVSEEDFSCANSALLDGYYLLVIRNKIFALDYDSYYFKNAPSYSDSRKAQRKQVWYLWELPKPDERLKFQTFISYGNKCAGIQIFWTEQEENGIIVVFSNARSFEFSNGDDDEDDYCVITPKGLGYVPEIFCYSETITSMMQSKLFDFGAPDRYKKIEQLYIGFGEAAGKTNITYLTESGTLNGGGLEIVGTGEDYSPEYINIHRFLPGIMRALRFGIRLECEGRISVSDVVIKYKPMGVKR